MDLALMFLAGLFFANGIPHFIHGASGEPFHTPFVYRLVPAVPSTLVNSVWGLGNFLLAAVLISFLQPSAGPNAQTGAAAVGFAVASVGLSLYFPRRSAREARQKDPNS